MLGQDVQPEIAGFLDAIGESPDDDTPRLILADWLDDHGDSERAEFIRLQCEMAKLPEGHPRYRKLLLKERKLLKTHSTAWRGWIAQMGFDVVFHRGFLDEVVLSAEIFVQQARALTQIPTLRLVGLRDIRGNLELVKTIAEMPVLRRLRGLRFEPIDVRLIYMEPEAGFTAGRGLTDDGLQLLLQSPYLQELETLELPNNSLSDRACAILADAKQLQSLRSLSLHFNQIEANGAAALARAPHLARLRKLDLSSTYLRQAGIQALIGAQYLTELTELNLGRSRLLTGDVQALLRQFPFQKLTVLKLNHLNIQKTAAEALAKCSRLLTLEVLELNQNGLADKGAEALARAPQLVNLKVLRLRRNRITVQGAEALANSPYLKKLEVLELGSNPISKDERKTLRDKFGKDFAKF